ncbi:glycosyl transferase [Thiohalobacter sp. COW1]|uniref:sugar transferase n=1 Tax=Thiohalobacter sp. COW1 TaxID=2795687 RepID=UPI001934F299|nr:sugar transferase [Thiohalobacter sp. COW1]BCO30375.1 glycosyl transferase [Thiohalobacter sp. COW1]
MIAKRLLDLLASYLGIIVLLPVFMLVAILIKCDSAGPIFYRQRRIGLHGKEFFIYKFRTMVNDADKYGASITVDGDARITNVGRVLRKTKLDELPQLLNIIRGDMSLVGPRPEVPEYISLYPKESRDLVLSVRPGITDMASIAFSDENAFLARYDNPHQAYIDIVLPKKVEYYESYVRNRTMLLDLKIVLLTLLKVVGVKV